MSILDYVTKVGYDSFKETPYNEVDLMALIDLSYLPFQLWVPQLDPAHPTDEHFGISLLEIQRHFMQSSADFHHRNPLMVTKYRYDLLKCLARLPRYQQVKFSQMYTKIDPDLSMEYSSLVMTFPDVTEQFIVFRGSNASMISWKENAKLITQESVPAQYIALEYLNEIYRQLPGPFVLTGHSKGGHLALFGAYFTDYKDAPSPFIKASRPLMTTDIQQVITFDSPGLTNECVKMARKHPLTKITKQYIPESVVVGSRLHPVVPPTIIASRSFSVFQHDLRFWKVSQKNFHLIETNQISAFSYIFNETYEQWSSEFTPDEILEFYDVLFHLLTLMGYSSFNEVDRDLLNFLTNFKMYYGTLSDHARILINRLGYRFLELTKENLAKNSTLFSKITTTKSTATELAIKYSNIKEAIENTLSEWLPPWNF